MAQELLENIEEYLLSGTGYTFNPNATSLVRFHNSKLSQIGDLCFPIKSEIWENYLKIPVEGKDGQILSTEDEEHSMDDLKKCSQNWRFPLAEVKLQKDRCALYLNRRRFMEAFLQEVLLTDNYGAQPKDPEKLVRIEPCESRCDVESITEYRAMLVSRTLQRMLPLSEWTEVADGVEDEAVVKTIRVLSAGSSASNGKDEAPVMAIKCGTVLDPQSGKRARITAGDYMKQRSIDMRLMAMHKYGIRGRDDKKLCELFERLGKAAVTVDLLEVKPSSQVSIIRSGQGSTKGASFILYNSARLETLLRRFDENVLNGIYEKLPPLANIDLDLLNSEEEWELMYGYLFPFPTLIQRCIGTLDSGSCGVHHLIKYLDGFVSTFSVYYRRIRILTEKRPQLMPHVYARIYLLKAIQKVFNKALALLDIQPVQFM